MFDILSRRVVIYSEMICVEGFIYLCVIFITFFGTTAGIFFVVKLFTLLTVIIDIDSLFICWWSKYFYLFIKLTTRFPTIWKTAPIIQILTYGYTDIFENYRAISKFCIIVKLSTSFCQIPKHFCMDFLLENINSNFH